MKLAEMLQKLGEIAQDSNISEPFIVGGIPRDKVLGKLSDIEDIDITTGDQSVHDLSKKFAVFMSGQNLGTDFIKHEDGHSTVFTAGLKFDFSSNFISKYVDVYLFKKDNVNPSDLDREMFSRDFTCNTLLMTMDMKTIKDPLGSALVDIREKMVRTNMPPRITLSESPNRIIRSVYLAAKLGFEIDDEIISWVRRNPEYIKSISDNFVSSKLSKSADYDLEKTIRYLTEMNIWDHIRVPKDLLPYMV